MTNEKFPVDFPKNLSLPFFTYGIFKPGQIAYSRIEKYVYDFFPSQINYRMLIRDGVPLINPDKSEHSKTDGFLIKFKEKSSKKAYKTICITEPKELYEWKVIKVGDIKANVLVGKNHNIGSSSIEGNYGYYDGQKDPFFDEAIRVVEKELDREFKGMGDMEGFLKLQMAYILLWTSIERYCSLKYDIFGSKINKLSRDWIFRKGLKRYVNEKRTVFSADDLRDYTLNPEEPYDSVRYYYTIRCNVAHRGKAIYADEKMLRQSLEELLNIYKDILDDTFNKD